MINYDPFWAYLAKHGISTYKLINSYGVSKGLIDRMKHNKAITTFTINELCNTLDCNLNDIMVFVPDNSEVLISFWLGVFLIIRVSRPEICSLSFCECIL